MTEAQKRYFLEFAYRGTHFHGWQKQPGERTVQGVLEEALAMVLRAPTEVTGCGRTDTGVHAARFFAHFDTTVELPADLRYKLNSLLGPDLAFAAVHGVDAEAHARFDATQRAYEYRMHFEADPFAAGLSFHWRGDDLDVASMDDGAAALLDFTDFASFCKTHHSAKTTTCRLVESHWLRDVDRYGRARWIYRIAADRFLRGMVRLIVGGLLDLGRGKLDLGDFRSAVAAGERLPHATSAPAEGLYLVEVDYPYID